MGVVVLAQQQRAPGVVVSSDPRDLALVCQPGVVAVICDQGPPPDWFDGLSRAVRSGGLDVGRLFLPFLGRGELESEVCRVLGQSRLERSMAEMLASDLLGLAAMAAQMVGAERVQLRLMTLDADRRFGFHVDIADTNPAVRVLRVYAGPGAEYVDPGDVADERLYYRHFMIRERVARLVSKGAWEKGTPESHIVERLREIDENPGFLRCGGAVKQVPAGAIVAVRCVDRRQLWARPIAAGSAVGWIHRSPADGGRRCFAAVST